MDLEAALAWKTRTFGLTKKLSCLDSSFTKTKLLSLIARITSSVQDSLILQYVFSKGTKSQISLKKLDVTDV